MELMKRIRHSLQMHVKSLGQKTSAAQKNDLLEHRNCLAVRISAFERKGLEFLMLDNDIQWSTGSGKVENDADDAESSDWDESDEDEIEQGCGSSGAMPSHSPICPGTWRDSTSGDYWNC